MQEKNSSNYITSSKNIIIGNKKRSVFVIKPNTEKKSSTKQISRIAIKRLSGCGGCSRRRIK